jgi:hypothetical protein
VPEARSLTDGFASQEAGNRRPWRLTAAIEG